MNEIYFYLLMAAYLAIIFMLIFFQRRTVRLLEADKQAWLDLEFRFGAACGAIAVKLDPKISKEEMIEVALELRTKGPKQYIQDHNLPGSLL